MSNSQPEMKHEEKKTRSSKPKLKDRLMGLIPKKKEKPENTSSGKITRKEQKAKQKAEKKKNKKPRRRAFPIWLRLIVVILLCAIALFLGAIIGFGVIGSGKPSDALDMDTWRHIFDIVTEKK